MRRFSLRARLVAGAVAAIAVAVVLLGVAVLARLDSQLNDAIDSALRARAVEVARLAASTPAILDQPGSLEGRLGGSSLFVQVVDAQGRLIARSSGLGSRVLPDAGAARAARVDRRAGYGDGALGTDPIRVYAAPLGELGRGPARGGAVVVAGTKAEIEATLDTTRRFVVLSAVVAALVAGLLATLLATGALRPLRRLSAVARRIERSGDASARLPIGPARDEVGQLAGTLNGMLGSLERAREAEQRFVGDASHELRTPLTVLRGNAAYIARHGPDPDVLADIQSDIARLSGLLDDLLALAREDASAPVRGEPVDLAELARATAAAEPGARPGEIEDPALVLAEVPALERAVGNLVHNARRHGPEGGRIELAAGAAAGVAWISVADEGPGLTPAEAERAFERFWRGSGARGEGSGLGLAIVRAIAERHGGRVTAAGARFTIELPAPRSCRSAPRSRSCSSA